MQVLFGMETFPGWLYIHGRCKIHLGTCPGVGSLHSRSQSKHLGAYWERVLAWVTIQVVGHTTFFNNILG